MKFGGRQEGARFAKHHQNPAVDDEPAWSPDGSKIAFQSERDGNFEIYVTPARADGGAGRQANTGAIVKSLAVLPFKVGGASGEDAYMGVGLADALTARLGQLRQISVRPTSAVRAIHLDAGAREVGARWVLIRGGRRIARGAMVRFVVQLTDVSEAVCWGRKVPPRSLRHHDVQSLIGARGRAMTLE